MADPTEAEIRLMADYAVLALEELRQLAEADGTNILGVEGQFFSSVKGTFAPNMLAGWSAWRRRVSDALSRGIARTLLDPILLAYGKLINSPEVDPVRIFRKSLYDYFVTNSYTVVKRGFTFGSASYSGVGDGALSRLNVDENNFDLDEQTADTKIFTCIRDEHSGASEHREEFEIRGQERTIDFLTLKGGSGQPGDRPVGEIRALSCKDSRRFLQNPSFTDSALTYTGGLATPTAVTDVRGWTLDSVTSVQLDRNITYRDSDGEASGTATSLRWGANRYIQQNLNVRRATVPETNIGGLGQELAPIYVQIAVYRESSADGTITLTVGSQTVTLNVGAQSNAAWTVLRMTLGQKNWFKTWNQEDPLIKIAWTSRTTGSVLIDDIIVAPFTQFDGGWYAIVGGATPFLRGDAFTVVDTVTEGGELQKWFVRAGYGHLPSTASTPSWGDPPPTPTPTPTPRTPTPTPTVTPTPTPTP